MHLVTLLHPQLSVMYIDKSGSGFDIHQDWTEVL